MLRTLRFIANHPLTRDRRLPAYARFAKWQVQSRLQREVEVDWIEGAKLFVRNGMTGATGNIYCGLHEFEEMAFLLHFLRDDDVFADVGANVGSYTVLASRACGARTVSFEPDPIALESLRQNVAANGIRDKVDVVPKVVGAATGTVRFSVGRDTMNRVIDASDPGGRDLAVTTLDIELARLRPTFIKVDVEGHEDAVMAGAHAVLADRKLKAIQIETVSNRTLQQLYDVGFESYRYDPFSRVLVLSGRTPEQQNQLFLREPAFVESRVAEGRPFSALGVSI